MVVVSIKIELAENDIEDLKKKGYSDQEIKKAIKDLEHEAYNDLEYGRKKRVDDFAENLFRRLNKK